MNALRRTVLAAALAACAPSHRPPATPQASGFPANSSTILSGEAARSLAHQCSRVSPGPVESVWSPSAADVSAVENGLPSVIETHLRGSSRGNATPRDYYRQYAGFVIGGKRVIYVNGVHREAIERDPNPEHPFDWRTQAVQICDGGAITFGVEYYTAIGEFSRFAFNGSLG